MYVDIASPVGEMFTLGEEVLELYTRVLPHNQYREIDRCTIRR